MLYKLLRVYRLEQIITIEWTFFTYQLLKVNPFSYIMSSTTTSFGLHSVPQSSNSRGKIAQGWISERVLDVSDGGIVDSNSVEVIVNNSRLECCFICRSITDVGSWAGEIL